MDSSFFFGKSKSDESYPPIHVNLKNSTGVGGNAFKNTVNLEVPKELLIHHIDVGQGEATLITLLEREVVQFTVLIDGGRYTRGGGTIVRYLRKLNISRIDIMICTHHDADHIEGLIRVLEDEQNSKTGIPITVGSVIDRQASSIFVDPTGDEYIFDDLTEEEYAGGRRFCEVEIPKEEKSESEGAEKMESVSLSTVETEKEPSTGDDEDEQLRKIIVRFKKLVGSRGRTVNSGSTFAVSTSKNPNLKLTCLHVNAIGTLPSEENNYSIAILVEYGKFRYFTGGDLESEYEDKFIDALKGDTHLCTFKCGHHGSRNSTSEEFLRRTEARRGIISCGHHSYYHPDSDLVARLCASAHLKQFFLTNCYYNRLGINSNYLGQELSLLGGLTELMVETAEEVEQACADWQRALNWIANPGSTRGKALELANQFIVRSAQLTVLCQSLKTNVLHLMGPTDPALADVKKEIKALHEALLVEKTKVAANSNFSTWNQQAASGFIDNVSVVTVKAKIRRLGDRTKAGQDMMDRYTVAEGKIQSLEEKGGHANDLIKGVVAGGDGHLGTIVLHITSSQALLDDHAYHIGFWNFSFDEEWRWLPQCCDPDSIAHTLIPYPKWDLGDACAIISLQTVEPWTPQRQWFPTMTSDKVTDFSLVTGSSGAQKTKKTEKQPLSTQEKKELLKQQRYDESILRQHEQNNKRQKLRDQLCASCGASSARNEVVCTVCNKLRNVCRRCRTKTDCPMHL